ncbi:30S ribosomal protein S2 [Patescibacteria group bacterium]|nr:30S ribosomal protein S2 [Patescibacteria group bacterium]
MYKLPTLQELLEAGVHFGHQVRRGHPRMRPYIYGAKDGVSVIDLTKSDELLKEACEFVYNLGQSGKVLLFVGTKKQARPIVEGLAKQLQAPYLIERWMGGFLTNHEEIKKNIKLLKDFKIQKEKGELSKYTKKEQLLLNRKMEKLEKDFSGVLDLEGLPDAIFVTDAVSENIAVREAIRLGIPVVALADSNCDPTQIDHPIPGNDDAIKSITILVTAIANAYGEGKKEAGKVAAKSKEKEEKAAKVKAAEETTLTEEVAEAEEKVEKETVKDFERVVK